MQVRWSVKVVAIAIAGGTIFAMGLTLIGSDNRHAKPMLKGLNTWHVKTLFTIGDSLPSLDQPYQPVGIPDGIGALSLTDTTVRVFVNHELVKQAGYEYQLKNGTRLSGARVSFFDLDRTSLTIVNSGMAFEAIHDRQGTPVTEASQINEKGNSRFGLSRLCSSHLIQAGTYNFMDTIYFTGEEALDPPVHPHGGTLWALDVQNQTLHAVPAAGRMSLENIAPLHTAQGHTAFLISDDSLPQSQEPNLVAEIAHRTTPANQIVSAPLWLYIGTINATDSDMKRIHLDGNEMTDHAFLNRNGLLIGDLFYFVADHSVRRVSQFKGTGNVTSGTWKRISVRDVSKAGQPGHDGYGYKNGFTLRREAQAGGAFQFSRPEDLSPNPIDGSNVVLASTGRDTVFPDDAWGTIYDIHVDTQKMTATLRILYDSDDKGGGQFAHPDDGIRNPDNLDWGPDGVIYIQEGSAKTEKPFFGTHSKQEASIWSLDPKTGKVERIAQIDRTAIGSTNSTDSKERLIGAWEPSGILDVTQLLAQKEGERVLLATVQAHTVHDRSIQEANLVESGQLVLIRNRPFEMMSTHPFGLE